jgi:hypothetical protein
MRKTEALVILFQINDCNRRRARGYVPCTIYSLNNALLLQVIPQGAVALGYANAALIL